MLDGAAADPLSHFDQINQELVLFNPALADRPQIVVLNKMDLPEARDRWPEVEAAVQARELTAYAISAATGEGVHTLMAQVGQMLSSLPRPEPAAEEIPIFRFDETPEFVVEQEADGWRVRGERVERLAAQTMWQYHDAVQRAQRVLDAMGVLDALRQAGVQPGDTVRIGDLELEWMW
jgi:GTP-binding protein